MPRLRRVDCSGTGIARRRRGRGFEYFWTATGDKVTDEQTLQRIRDLVIPPAWADVWICPWPNGHLQAVGTDAAGRRQYRYHDAWRARRDAEKFDRMLEFARGLPALREACTAALSATDGPLSRDRVLACAVRLLDQGFFRIGTESYAEDNDSYGLATMRKEHVGIDGEVIRFDYPAKGGRRRVVQLADPAVCDVVARLKRRRSGPEELLVCRESPSGPWRNLTSTDINQHVKDLLGDEYSAKWFRTWNATVLAAVALAVAADAGTSATARRRVMAHVVQEVAHYLGNTPAVARGSYIDPRVFDRYESGWTIAGVLHELGDEAAIGAPSIQGVVEEAVLDLLSERTDSPGVMRRVA
jgi:DNA topoisomerase I